MRLFATDIPPTHRIMISWCLTVTILASGTCISSVKFLAIQVILVVGICLPPDLAPVEVPLARLHLVVHMVMVATGIIHLLTRDGSQDQMDQNLTLTMTVGRPSRSVVEGSRSLCFQHSSRSLVCLAAEARVRRAASATLKLWFSSWGPQRGGEHIVRAKRQLCLEKGRLVQS